MFCRPKKALSTDVDLVDDWRTVSVRELEYDSKEAISCQLCPTTFSLLFYPLISLNPYLYTYSVDAHHIIQEMTTKNSR